MSEFGYVCYTCGDIIHNEAEEKDHIRRHRDEMFAEPPTTPEGPLPARDNDGRT